MSGQQQPGWFADPNGQMRWWDGAQWTQQVQGVQAPPVVVVKQGPGCLKIGLIVFAILAVLGIALAACTGFVVNEAAKDIGTATREVTAAEVPREVTACERNILDYPEAKGTITNKTTTRQGFQVDVRFEIDGVLLADSPTFIDAIDPGKQAIWSTVGLEPLPTGAVPTCTVTVSRSIFDNETG